MLSLIVCAASSGVVAHQCIFKRLDFDAYPFSIGAICVAAHLAVVRCLQILSPYPNSASLIAFILSSCFLIGLGASMLLYRAFFHPLKQFSGPSRAKLSKFWSIRLVLQSQMRWYQVLDELHQTYGDYGLCNTGPRELSISDPAAIIPVLGLSSKTTKGPFYGSMQQTVHTTRDKAFHRRRRRIWDVAFKEALASYGPRIEEFTGSFLARIERNASKAININDICTHFSYDVMSALAFGHPAGFTNEKCSEKSRRVLEGIHVGMDAIAVLIHVPWVMTMLEACSSLPSPMKLFNDWSKEQVEFRSKMQNPQPDIMGHLMKHTPDDADGRNLLNAESRLIIGAGSDTTAIALSLAFVYLAMYPSYTQRIRQEADENCTSPDYSSMRRQPIIDSVINEVLRLHPPVTFGAQRVTPPEGLIIGNVPIPGNTIVSIPAHLLARDTRSFLYPRSFIPERWTTRPEMVLNRTAFMPFSAGPYNCAGKNLAMMELRSVISRVAQQYDISFPANEPFAGDSFFARMTDHFTLGVPKQSLVFTRRAN
ncbi:putative benzoate 4-monooxygenase cytochrome P450 [Saccharata proteae CBS 121410]|uniref:Benzoate 4-monooxygenase cytochrome P450 n=1 Tax=Saccharata proteae CBS 121410 TaxID=1314787 RepID=A0A9P4HYC1_9PEZI|nr:putative benzoate 4-monooxygenase cytochrome P450 [Saccharata proteae CBS 121410]